MKRFSMVMLLIFVFSGALHAYSPKVVIYVGKTAYVKLPTNVNAWVQVKGEAPLQVYEFSEAGMVPKDPNAQDLSNINFHPIDNTNGVDYKKIWSTGEEVDLEIYFLRMNDSKLYVSDNYVGGISSVCWEKLEINEKELQQFPKPKLRTYGWQGIIRKLPDPSLSIITIAVKDDDGIKTYEQIPTKPSRYKLTSMKPAPEKEDLRLYYENEYAFDVKNNDMTIPLRIRFGGATFWSRQKINGRTYYYDMNGAKVSFYSSEDDKQAPSYRLIGNEFVSLPEIEVNKESEYEEQPSGDIYYRVKKYDRRDVWGKDYYVKNGGNPLQIYVRYHSCKAEGDGYVIVPLLRTIRPDGGKKEYTEVSPFTNVWIPTDKEEKLVLYKLKNYSEETGMERIFGYTNAISGFKLKLDDNVVTIDRKNNKGFVFYRQLQYEENIIRYQIDYDRDIWIYADAMSGNVTLMDDSEGPTTKPMERTKLGIADRVETPRVLNGCMNHISLDGTVYWNIVGTNLWVKYNGDQTISLYGTSDAYGNESSTYFPITPNDKEISKLYKFDTWTDGTNTYWQIIEDPFLWLNPNDAKLYTLKHNQMKPLTKWNDLFLSSPSATNWQTHQIKARVNALSRGVKEEDIIFIENGFIDALIRHNDYAGSPAAMNFISNLMVFYPEGEEHDKLVAKYKEASTNFAAKIVKTPNVVAKGSSPIFDHIDKMIAKIEKDDKLNVDTEKAEIKALTLFMSFAFTETVVNGLGLGVDNSVNFSKLIAYATKAEEFVKKFNERTNGDLEFNLERFKMELKIKAGLDHVD